MNRRIIPLTIVLLWTLSLASAAASQAGERSDAATPVLTKKDQVTVYYFHATRRCVTCRSIESIARGAIKDKYGDRKDVVFTAVNLEKEKNKALVEKYEIATSALLVCCGKEKVDLTAKAFQYARSNPDKLQDALIAAVDKFLKK